MKDKRMRRVGVTLPLVRCVAAATGAHAGFHDGNSLLENCKGPVPSGDVFCMAYIAGVTDTLINSTDGSKICMRPHITLKQLEDTMMLWLSSHPEVRDDNANALVRRVLEEKFPCPQ